jgi:hypothetical protein
MVNYQIGYTNHCWIIIVRRRMSRFFDMLLRYILAIIVAFAVSCGIGVSMFAGISFLATQGVPDTVIQFLLFIPVFMVGVCGVSAGGMCLERASRRGGSIALFVLGLTLFAGVMCSIQYPGMANDDHPYLWLVNLTVLAGGGSLGVTFVFRQASNNSQKPPPIDATSPHSQETLLAEHGPTPYR